MMMDEYVVQVHETSVHEVIVVAESAEAAKELVEESDDYRTDFSIPELSTCDWHIGNVRRR